MRAHLLIDADDTLWENNIHFEQAIEEFIAFLNHPRLSREEARAALDEVEHRMGYGSANFTRSLVETYRRLVEGEPLDEDIARVRKFGERIHAQPIQLLDGVRETLAYLTLQHDLILLTKGEADEQRLKIERSGIESFFRRIVIVPEKDVNTYRRIIRELGLEPQRTWMVGNSPRSDINPALAAGLNAIYIAHPQTWRLEQEEIMLGGAGHLMSLASFTDLRTHF
jgi:putative hydrolase of the HAD superfamily